ncbi:MAG: poly-gamma-glutamate biosynthesis protein PgsC [Candidatus Neomarinimicrobiota bacterium]
MIAESIFLGILLGFVYYELVGLTPGGIIIPGYIAIFLDRGWMLLTTLLVVLITLLLIMGLSRLVILYGRRAFLAAVMIGFLLKWGIESYLIGIPGVTHELEVIGYIIPGLIANEMRKQGIGATLASLLVVSGTTHLLVRLQQYYS